MSILEKPQIIHIISEVVVFIGITLYFSQKNKKLMNHINDLMQRLEDQEDIIQKHEQIINKLSNIVSELCQQPPSLINIIKHEGSNSGVLHPQPSNIEEIPKAIKNPTNRIISTPMVEEIINNDSEEELEDEINLDNELAEELKDLETI